MTTAGYSMLTVASCETAYLEQALKHVGVFVSDLKSMAGAVGVRYGMIATGEHAGHILLVQSYENLGGIENLRRVSFRIVQAGVNMGSRA